MNVDIRLGNNWEGANEGCTDDGTEPYYMLSNKEYFLSNTREECCKKFYEFDFNTCAGTVPELTNGDYYPDWSGSSNPCRNDGKIPSYMLTNQPWYLSTTRRQCCERHFFWDVRTCLGTDSEVEAETWYVDYNAETCKKGKAESWDEV